ncbi:MAG: extensin family protein, partial [Pyrinomonadaceae bacterium]
MNSIPKKAKGNKIIEPWKTYFGRLETDPEFQKIQVKAVRGAISRARYWSDYFGFKTERGFAFMFDLVSSHGGWWLNAAKFKGKRIALLQRMLAEKKARLGRDTLTELEKMEVIANMIAEASSEEWRPQVRVRKLWFVRGTGKVHGSLFDIKKDFGVTDNPPDFGVTAATQPELEGEGFYPFFSASPGRMEYEVPKRRSVGTDCGRSAMPAAKLSQPGGRCTGTTPPVCPPVTGILSEQAVSGIPFEYVDKVGKDPASNLAVVTRRLRPRKQKFLPSVRSALAEFIANMKRFGLPIEAILTAGSFCCRCISRTNRLSNHSYGDAFDLVGLRWAASGGRETIMHNWNTAERPLLRRINACLRLSFANVIDYHNKDHRDHLHCDMNHGAKPNPSQPTTMRFAQEALSVVLGRTISITGRVDAATRAALIEFAGGNSDALKTSAQLKQVLTKLFTRIAATPTGSSTQRSDASLTHEVS